MAVVISGTVTDRLAPAVAAIIDGCEQQAGGDPRSFPSGLARLRWSYWDSYAVTKVSISSLPWTRTCRAARLPEALSAVLDQLIGRVAS